MAEVTPPGINPADIAPGPPAMGWPRGLRFKDLALQIYLQNQRYQQQAFQPFLGFEQDIARQRAKYDPLLYESITNPTASPSYQMNLKEGLDALGARNASIGSSVSGPSQIAQGRFAQGLAGDEMDKANQRLMAAQQFRGILPQTQEPQYGQLAVGTKNASSNWINAGASLMQAQAAKKAASGGGGGFFSDLLGTTIGTLGAAAIGHFFPPAAPAAGGSGTTSIMGDTLFKIPPKMAPKGSGDPMATFWQNPSVMTA